MAENNEKYKDSLMGQVTIKNVLKRDSFQTQFKNVVPVFFRVRHFLSTFIHEKDPKLKVTNQGHPTYNSSSCNNSNNNNFICSHLDQI